MEASYEPSVLQEFSILKYTSIEIYTSCQKWEKLPYSFPRLTFKDTPCFPSPPAPQQLWNKMPSSLLRCHPTLEFSGSSVSSAGLEGLPSSPTSWCWHSGSGLQPRLLSASCTSVCSHSWSCRTSLSRHLMHHCWHHHLSTSHTTRIFFARASSIVQRHPRSALILREITQHTHNGSRDQQFK